MTARFQTVRGFNSTNPLTIFNTSVTWSVSSSGVYDTRYPVKAIDGDFGSRTTAVNWVINFSKALKLSSMKIYWGNLSDRGPYYLQGYTTAGVWVNLSQLLTPPTTEWTFQDISLNEIAMPDCTSFRLYRTNKAYLGLYDISITFLSDTTNIDFDGCVIPDPITIGFRDQVDSSGLLIDCDENEIQSGVRSQIDNSGLVLPEQFFGDRELNLHLGVLSDTSEASIRNKQATEGVLLNEEQTGKRFGDWLGIHLLDVTCGGRKHNKCGIAIDEALDVNRDKHIYNFNKIEDIEIGVRTPENNIKQGIAVEPLNYSSDASYRYILTVTPTHQHRSMPVTVTLESRSTTIIVGKYFFELDGTVIIQPADTNEVINNIKFVINPRKLTNGINKARINLLYHDSSQEYFDFEIVKEETKRTIAQRLFRDYDGGFDGEYYAPPKILVPSIYPCWMAKENILQSTFRTGEHTRVSLLHYTDIQGVTIDGINLLVLVSFDKGTTWKSFINNVWTTVDLTNIRTYGMPVSTINSITIAQWTDAFAPTSIDFAICFNSGVSKQTLEYISGFAPRIAHTVERFDGKVITSVVDTYNGYVQGQIPGYRIVYSNLYPDGYTTTLPYTGGTSTYTAANNEIINRLEYYAPNTGSNYTKYNHTVNGYVASYLKSITVNMTPSPFTGYAFII
jgi:hypothetical protein